MLRTNCQYDIDNYGTLRIYSSNGHLICSVSDCGDLADDELENLVDEILTENGYTN